MEAFPCVIDTAFLKSKIEQKEPKTTHKPTRITQEQAPTSRLLYDDQGAAKPSAFVSSFLDFFLFTRLFSISLLVTFC